MTNHQFGVHNLEARESTGDVAGREHFFARNIDGGTLVLGVLRLLFQVNLLKIEYDVCYILLYAGHGIKFAFHPVDFYRRNRIAFERRQKYATEGVSDSDAIARFQRLEFKLAVEVGCFHHYNLFRFLEC